MYLHMCTAKHVFRAISVHPPLHRERSSAKRVALMGPVKGCRKHKERYAKFHTKTERQKHLKIKIT